MKFFRDWFKFIQQVVREYPDRLANWLENACYGALGMSSNDREILKRYWEPIEKYKEYYWKNAGEISIELKEGVWFVSWSGFSDQVQTDLQELTSHLLKTDKEMLEKQQRELAHLNNSFCRSLDFETGGFRVPESLTRDLLAKTQKSFDGIDKKILKTTISHQLKTMKAKDVAKYSAVCGYEVSTIDNLGDDYAKHQTVYRVKRGSAVVYFTDKGLYKMHKMEVK